MTTVLALAAAFSGLALLLHLAGIVVVLRRVRAPAVPVPPHRTDAAVTILRPVCGLENFLEETLASTFRLDHSRIELIFCVAQPSDPALPLLHKLIAAHPHVDARLLIGPSNLSANPKLNNMMKGWNAASHDWVLMVDSNVLMPPDMLRQMFAAWTPDAGLVSSPPVGGAPASLAAELECAILNTHQARWQCLADSAGYGFAQGKAMLWRREFLERHGGLRALGTEPAEDAAATRLVRAAGLKVRLAGRPFVQPLGARSLDDVWKRQVRWGRLRRDTFPAQFVPELLTGALPPLAAFGLLAAGLDWPLVPALAAFAVVWYAAEAALACGAGWHVRACTLAACVARDLMLPAIWVASWTGDDFDWRGNAMTVADENGSRAQPG